MELGTVKVYVSLAAVMCEHSVTLLDIAFIKSLHCNRIARTRLLHKQNTGQKRSTCVGKMLLYTEDKTQNAVVAQSVKLHYGELVSLEPHAPMVRQLLK